MPFPFYIARRYLLSKKSHNVINIISGISLCGVAIATAALICILSVFNGFQSMLADLFTVIDPQLKVVPAEGKYIRSDHPKLLELEQDKDIAVFTRVIEDNALAMLNNRQAMVTVKGVDDNFNKLVDIDKALYGDGSFMLRADVIDYGIFGIGILQGQFGVGTDYENPVQIFAPKKGERIDLNDPESGFNKDELYSPRVGLEVKQSKYDSNVVITSLRFAQKLFEKNGEVTAIELKVKDGVSIEKVEERLESLLGSEFAVKNRYEQQEDTFKIMKIEKLISYLFLTFILVVACFNIISSISMLLIDKKDDIITLRNMGASKSQIVSIFMTEGKLISLIGALAGIALGVTLCLLQQQFGFIKFGASEGDHIISTYPVELQLFDIVLTFVTVIVVGYISVWFPVKHFSKKFFM